MAGKNVTVDELKQVLTGQRQSTTLEKQAANFEIKHDSKAAMTQVRPEEGGDYVLTADTFYFAPLGRDLLKGAQFTINNVSEIERLLSAGVIASVGSPAARAAQGDLDERMVRNMPSSLAEADRRVAVAQAQAAELKKEHERQKTLSEEFQASVQAENRPTVASPAQFTPGSGQGAEKGGSQEPDPSKQEPDPSKQEPDPSKQEPKQEPKQS